jgi:hypothetical protein
MLVPETATLTDVPDGAGLEPIVTVPDAVTVCPALTVEGFNDKVIAVV